MVRLSVEIVRCVDGSYPGFVECRFTDAGGREWVIVEKSPVVTPDYLEACSTYPQPGVVASQVDQIRHGPDGRQLVTIDSESPWHVETTTGQTRFDVWPEQFVELDSGWSAKPAGP